MSFARNHARLKAGLWTFLFLMVGSVVLAQSTSGHDPYAELALLARLNEWRISLDLAPLKRNTTLDALALLQARYVSTLRPYPDGVTIHRGRTGELVKDRALWEPYQWPTYGTAQQIAIEEIAAIHTLDGAIGFWKGSPPHRHAATNPTYREVGMAALSIGRDRYIYIVVLGARPGVLPSLYDPETGMIHLTRERYAFATGHPSLKIPTRLRYFDAAGLPMFNGEWFDWAEQIPVPEGAGDKLYLLLSDGTYETLSEVDLGADVVWLPALVPTITPTPSPTVTLTATLSPTPRISPTPTATLTPTPVPGPEILLLYDDDALTLISMERYSTNLTGLELVGENSTLPVYWWSNVRAFAFAPGFCAQAYSAVVSQPPARPAECRVLQDQRGRLRPDQRFWLVGEFEVRQNGEAIAICEAAAGRCEVDLPGQP